MNPTTQPIEKGEEPLKARESSLSAEAATAQSAAAIGQWAVVVATWPKYAAVGPISRVTAQRIYHPASFNAAREAYSDMSRVLLIGANEVARSTVEKLVSSRALRDQERHAAGDRHRARVADIIAKATGHD